MSDELYKIVIRAEDGGETFTAEDQNGEYLSDADCLYELFENLKPMCDFHEVDEVVVKVGDWN